MEEMRLSDSPPEQEKSDWAHAKEKKRERRWKSEEELHSLKEK